MTRKQLEEQIFLFLKNNSGDGTDWANQFVRISILLDHLEEGVVHFFFRKTDGTLRSAYGTRNNEIVSRHIADKGGEGFDSRQFNGTLPFFDLEKDAWRCLRVTSLQEIDNDYGDFVTES